MPQIVLASTSPFRKELLERLHLPFETASPDVDETPMMGETPMDLVSRLAQSKAEAVAKDFPKALIISGDQVAVCEGEILGKPGDHENAVKQLRQISDKEVVFHTGICVYNAETDRMDTAIVPFYVHFRLLTEEMISRYLEMEPAYNCAGSFKSEGYGIALCEKLEGEDPTALVGLPLIRLTRMLEAAGVEVI